MKVAIIGGGVIGSGWAARFLLHGFDVSFFDPAPATRDKLTVVLDNARHSLADLYDLAPPAEGSLTPCPDIPSAVADANWVQESVPEQLDLKRTTLTKIEAHAKADAIIASSTSGFTPGDLGRNLAHPGRFIVCHPFNPVYLLPLVEVVGSADTKTGIRDRATAILASVGMKPLIVRKEIDAHIADRLLEAVWREALWLVKDGIATTEDIDDAIRFGFGLRWAQMGLFETYRIAGGDAGMAHFLEQFGPALQWPWSRLTDVPDLDDTLVTKIAAQSDAQSGAYNIRELEQIRDRNLVALLRALKTTDWGAGALLNRFEAGGQHKGEQA